MNQSYLPRRKVLKLLASVPAAVSLRGAERGMYLSLNSVLLKGRVGWPAFPQLAASTGFPGCDIMLAAAMKAGAAATRDLFSELNLRPAVIDFPVDFRKDERTFEASVGKLDETARFAKEIGCPRMITYILPSSDLPKEQLRHIYRLRFATSARILARHDVRLGLEFLGPLHLRIAKPNEFIWRMNEMLQFAIECGPNVGLLLDSWHWHHAGATTNDILHAGRERIVHVHFNDSPDLPPEQILDNQRLLPGEGVINLVGFLQALQKAGYQDALSVEVFGRMDQEAPEAAAKKGLEASEAVFRKAGIALVK